MSASLSTSDTAWVTESQCDLGEFAQQVLRGTDRADYPHATDVRRNVPFEPWQETVLMVIVALSFLVFARRAWRIGADLWRALHGLEPADEDGEIEDDDRSES